VANLINKVIKDLIEKKKLPDFSVVKEMKKGIGNALVAGAILQPSFAGLGFDFKEFIKKINESSEIWPLFARTGCRSCPMRVENEWLFALLMRCSWSYSCQVVKARNEGELPEKNHSIHLSIDTTGKTFTFIYAF
jgi:hypothetical protein